MLDNRKINLRQFTFLVILVTVGDLVMILPSLIAVEGGQDTWLASVIGLACGLLIVLLLCAAGMLYPRLTLVESIQKICGKWIGLVISLFFLGFIFISIVAHIREMGTFMTIHMLPNTPIQIIHIMFLSIVVMAVRLGLESFTRAAELFFFWFVVLLILFFILISPQINLDYYQSVMADGFKPVLRGSFVAAIFPFTELVVFLMIFPFITDHSKVRRHFIIGAFLGGLTLLIFTVLCALVLGTDLMERQLYAVYSLARKISVAEIIERTEVLFTSLWIITTFVKITLYYYVLSIGLSKIMKLKEYRMLVLPIASVISVFTILISPNVTYLMYIVQTYWPFLDLTYGVILPLFLLGVYSIRKKLTKREQIK